jgi:hypothetical protein
MKTLPFQPLAIILLAIILGAPPATAADESSRLAQLNGYWAEVSRTVREGDFEGYRATTHAEGVLVTGIRKSSQPLAKALERWQQDFVDTKSGKVKGNVEFRFSQRLGDETTAHETGVFHYTSVAADGQVTHDYIHFEVLLVKRDTWKTLMEYQKSKATREDWDALAPK